MSTERDAQAVRNVLDEWIEAVNTGDEEGLLSMVTDDLEMIPPNAQPVKGAQAHQLLCDFVQGLTAELKPFTDEEIVVSGDWAFQRYTFENTLTPKGGGDSFTDKGHGIHMFRRQSGGSWKLAKDIFTSPPPPSEET